MVRRDRMAMVGAGVMLVGWEGFERARQKRPCGLWPMQGQESLG